MIGSSAAGPFFEVVFALLVTELAIIGMLCVPVPGGLLRPVVRWVSTSSMLASLAKPLIWFGTLVGLSFLFTTREMLKLQEEYHDAKEYHDLGQKLQDPNPNPNPNPNPTLTLTRTRARARALTKVASSHAPIIMLRNALVAMPTAKVS